ncbi:formyltransferase family protein, partial [Haloferax profundi]|uniref:formyltransferase family protein n=1 Tax=Haloferax profundi TaxID=1544718 RepID=UPI0022B0E30F
EFATDDDRADVEVVIGNHSDLQRFAEQYGVPFHDIGDDGGNPDEEALLNLLDRYDIDLVTLARYIQILSPEVVFRYPGRIINVHPSLLPAFPGAAAYSQALNEGVRITGVTAHYVTPDLDQGPIITQRAFNIPNGASEEVVRDKGQPLEADALVDALHLHLDGKLTVDAETAEARDTDNRQLGLPDKIDWLNPNHPTDKSTSRVRQPVHLTKR